MALGIAGSGNMEISLRFNISDKVACIAEIILWRALGVDIASEGKDILNAVSFKSFKDNIDILLCVADAGKVSRRLNAKVIFDMCSYLSCNVISVRTACAVCNAYESGIQILKSVKRFVYGFDR